MKKLMPFLKTISSDLGTVWIMLTVGACCGFALNQLRDNPLPLVYSPKADRIQQAVAKISADTPAPCPVDAALKADQGVPTVHYLELPALREVVAQKDRGIILDARPEIFHRLGHIPGAISLPREEFEESYKKRRSSLEINKAQLITVYCSNSGCEDSKMVADALVKLAYTRVYVFKGGWDDWTAAHLPEEKAQ